MNPAILRLRLHRHAAHLTQAAHTVENVNLAGLVILLHAVVDGQEAPRAADTGAAMNAHCKARAYTHAYQSQANEPKHTIWVRWFSQSVHRFSVSQYVIYIFEKSNHKCRRSKMTCCYTTRKSSHDVWPNLSTCQRNCVGWRSFQHRTFKCQYVHIEYNRLIHNVKKTVKPLSTICQLFIVRLYGRLTFQDPEF